MDSDLAYEIRTLGVGDVGVLRGLLDCFGEIFDERETYCSAQPNDECLHGLLTSGWFVAIVAVIGEQVVGGLAGYELHKFEQPRSELFIYDLGVREPYRRRGIATALIEESRRVARSRGAWVVFLDAESDDPRAIALYSKLGVREDSVHFDIPVDPEDA